MNASPAITEASAITGKQLSQLSFKSGVLVAAILREDSVIIPRGYDSIEVGDTVIVVYEAVSIRDITDVLK